MNSVAALLTAQNVHLDVKLAGREQLLDAIGRALEPGLAVPARTVTASLQHREQIGSTALGQGIAIPHARLKELERIELAYWRLDPGIAYDAPDGKPVTDVLVILVPRQATEEHLRILADASEMFSDPRFRADLRACKDAQEVKRRFDGWPRRIF